MRFAPESDHNANAGLKTARDLLQQVKGKFLQLYIGNVACSAGLVPVLSLLGLVLYLVLKSGGHDGVISPTVVLLTFVRAKTPIV